MRKIEKEVNMSFFNYNNFKKSNTEVRVVNDIGYLYLFGNEIAKIDREEVKINLNTILQYPSKTTCSRLKSIGVELKVKNGIPKILSDHKTY